MHLITARATPPRFCTRNDRCPEPYTVHRRGDLRHTPASTTGDSPIRYYWLATFFAVLIWSAIHPKDPFTWFLEVLPALMGLLVLAWSYRSFRLSPLLYTLILIHAIILMIGGHYTYAEVPLFDELKTLFGWDRNHYDKLGHFAQGFVPAIITREIIIRKHIVRGDAWQAFFTICVCLALSALYELIEWWVALAVGENADAFLGTQGYVWDTQSDMGFALLGAVTAILTLRRWHDRQLASPGFLATPTPDRHIIGD